MLERSSTLALLAQRSLWHRRYTVSLLVLSIALSGFLLLAVERMRTEVRDSFTSTVSGTDLLVGARSSPLQLLLYAIFHKGRPTQNVSWESYQEFAHHPRVAWTIPLQLGDSHRGFRVVGTSTSFFQHYQYGRKQSLRFSSGLPFTQLYDAVVGARVAEKLGYVPGTEIIIAHGLEDVSFSKHKNHPFRITGVLAPTGTPIDNAVLVSLEALEAVHDGFKQMMAKSGRKNALTPDAITAFLVGMKSRATVFQVQKQINDYKQEPLQAVIPGVTLMSLWSTVSVVESTLIAIAGMVTLISLIGMMAMMLATLNERRREMALLRALGATPGDLFLLIVGESFVVCVLAVVLSMGLLNAVIALAGHWIEAYYGLRLTLRMPGAIEWSMMSGIVMAGVVTSCIPAWRAYRQSLVDGMTPR